MARWRSWSLTPARGARRRSKRRVLPAVCFKGHAAAIRRRPWRCRPGPPPPGPRSPGPPAGTGRRPAAPRRIALVVVHHPNTKGGPSPSPPPGGATRRRGPSYLKAEGALGRRVRDVRVRLRNFFPSGPLVQELVIWSTSPSAFRTSRLIAAAAGAKADRRMWGRGSAFFLIGAFMLGGGSTRSGVDLGVAVRELRRAVVGLVGSRSASCAAESLPVMVPKVCLVYKVAFFASWMLRKYEGSPSRPRYQPRVRCPAGAA